MNAPVCPWCNKSQRKKDWNGFAWEDGEESFSPYECRYCEKEYYVTAKVTLTTSKYNEKNKMTIRKIKK